MKHIFSKTLCAALALSLALLLGACGEENASKAGGATKDSAAATTAPATVATTAPTLAANEVDLVKLYSPKENGDLFGGYWQITDGAGKDLQHFVFGFDGAKYSSIIIGGMGFFGTYSVSVKDNRDVFTTQLMFGLNGSYTYDFSKDKNTVVLTNIESNESTTMQRLKDYTPVPEPLKEQHDVDEQMLGAWEDENGAQMYFNKEGILYETQKNISFTFYHYEAKDGKVTTELTVRNGQTETESADYKVKGDVLTYNQFDYKRIPVSELV